MKQSSNVRPFAELLIIFAAAMFVYGWKLGDSPISRTEPHRALTAHGMVQSGDWIIPRLLGEVYLRKPPLIYWTEAASEKLFGHASEFVWRFPSALGASLLAVFLAWMASRWFGGFARLPTALAYLSILALWDQNRGADIDALNTVTSVMTACVILEILYGPTRKPWAWMLALAVMFGATLLLKGPSGLTTILGALIGPCIFLRNWKTLRRKEIWIGLAVGVAIFATYFIIAKMEIRRQGLATDSGGLREALQRIVIHNFKDIPKVFITAISVLFFGLPVSLAIPFVFAMDQDDANTRKRIIALVGTFVFGMVIWIISGNTNPRYEYVMLPLLSPLIGAIAAGWHNGKYSNARCRFYARFLTVICIIYLTLDVFVSVKLWHLTNDQVSLGVGLCVASVMGFFAALCWVVGRYRIAAICSAFLIVLMAIPMADRKNIERRKNSAMNAAGQLHDLVGDQSLGAASMVRDQPELFYYARSNIKAFGETKLPQLINGSGPRWILLTENGEFPEYSTVMRDIPNAFPHGITRLNMPNPRDRVYVGLYDPPADAPRVVHYAIAANGYGARADD